MFRWRFLSVAILALALSGNVTQTGRTDDYIKWNYTSEKSLEPSPADEGGYKIYALNAMGYDTEFGQWIAQTIPEVIEPASWKKTGVLRYNASKNVLIVQNSAAVQTKVERFLKEMKAALPKEKAAASAKNKKTTLPQVVPAGYRAPALLPVSSNQALDASAYPVPAPVKAPKHLFHFLIRYEGEGIIDDNVVKFMKVQSQSERSAAPTNPVPSAPSVAETPNLPAVQSTAAPVLGISPVTVTPSIPPAAVSQPASAVAPPPPSSKPSVETPNPKNTKPAPEKKGPPTPHPF